MQAAHANRELPVAPPPPAKPTVSNGNGTPVDTGPAGEGGTAEDQESADKVCTTSPSSAF